MSGFPPPPDSPTAILKTYFCNFRTASLVPNYEHLNGHIATGRKGEDIAARFLAEQGYTILKRNFVFGKCEIDLIAQKGDWLLFIEVKTRSAAAYGFPEEFVDAAQASRILYAAEEFIFTTNWQGHVRFDIISIGMGDPPEVVHFQDAIN